jgi:hypothetical protein
MLELLLASQERASAEIKASLEKIDAEMKARAVARHERYLAFLDGLTFYGEGTTTSQTETTSSSEEMEATNLEATPEATEAAVERQKLHENEINFDTIGSSEDRCEDQRLAVRRRRGAKKRSQASVGSRQKVSAARKRVIRRAIPAVRKVNILKSPGKNNAAKGASKGKMLVKRQQNSCECENGRLDRDIKKRLYLRMKTTSERITTKPRELTSLLGLLFAIREVNENTFWKVRPPPKRKKDVRTA